MKVTVWKYELPEPGQEIVHKIPRYSEFLCLLNGFAYLKIDLAYANDGNEEKDDLHIKVVGTGHIHDLDRNCKHAGSWMVASPLGPLIWHAFYTIRPAVPKNRTGEEG